MSKVPLSSRCLFFSRSRAIYLFLGLGVVIRCYAHVLIIILCGFCHILLNASSILIGCRSFQSLSLYIWRCIPGIHVSGLSAVFGSLRISSLTLQALRVSLSYLHFLIRIRSSQEVVGMDYVNHFWHYIFKTTLLSNWSSYSQFVFVRLIVLSSGFDFRLRIHLSEFQVFLDFSLD